MSTHYTNVRKVTCQLLEAVDEGVLSWEAIAQAALTFMSERDLAEMARINELLPIDDEDLED